MSHRGGRTTLSRFRILCLWQAITSAPLWSPDENEFCAESFLFDSSGPRAWRPAVRRWSLPDTEVAEDHVQELVDAHHAGNAAERPQGQPEVFGRQRNLRRGERP